MPTRTTVYDLAVEVFLYLVAFQRRCEEGEAPNYFDARSEVLALLNDLDQRSHSEEGLHQQWSKARVPLIYLIDEIMILNAAWDHRSEWANENLEVTVLGHPEALGGENFYTECDSALRAQELAERHERRDYEAAVELVMVFYVSMQLGFKGRYAIDLDAWREYKAHVFSKLPAYAQTRAKQFTPETEQHTVRLDPNYEPVMRLLYVVLGFFVILGLYFATTWGWWSNLISDLRGYTQPGGAVAVPAAETPPPPPAEGGGA